MILVQQVQGGACASAFITSSQERPVLLDHALNSEDPENSALGSKETEIEVGMDQKSGDLGASPNDDINQRCDLR